MDLPFEPGLSVSCVAKGFFVEAKSRQVKNLVYELQYILQLVLNLLLVRREMMSMFEVVLVDKEIFENLAESFQHILRVFAVHICPGLLVLRELH